MSALAIYYYSSNHSYYKILKSDWLSTVLISALTGQFDKTVRAITRALKWLFFNASKKTWNFLYFDSKKSLFLQILSNL